MRVEQERRRLGDDAVVAKQLRAARAALGWSQAELAARSGVAARSILDLETRQRRPQHATLTKLRAAMIDAGILFVNDHRTAGVLFPIAATPGIDPS